MAAVAALFAALMRIAALGGWQESGLVACYLAVFAIGGLLAPRYLLDPCEFAVTDRRVLWRRGRSVRSIERHAITYARVRWHRSVPGVGSLELVRAVPFGPLARSQRLVMHDLPAPDRVLAIIRDVEPTENAGDDQISLTDRLDEGEQVLWGAGPEGFLLGWQDVLITIGGAAVVLIGLRYGVLVGSILMDLEEVGLAVGSMPWVFLFSATMLTFAMIVGVGGALVWYGLVRARAQGRETEYIVTDRRLLIRRGRTELSLDRERIFDVAEAPSWRGLRNVFLILDGPGARALGDTGALTGLTPPRDAVPPVLYELRDTERVRDLLSSRDARDSLAA
ncbi:hypothetical protein DB32_005346 [Sandaracinus amylolyticus]|uniref:DUF304 domain-containing protein n=2 Tax=Sandaracinus amylolyticus TaxID=927083 RepID=A0A0F6YKI9_9BACT|nr:hypothetical protein DB32_005346 [Sandaracinus amylolyticus]